MTYTCTQDMLLTTARSTTVLDDDARARIIDFLHSQQNPDGGFAGRTKESDLYYTLFAMASLFSLKKTVQADVLQNYLASFKDLNQLDFVHLASLARCRASLPYLKYIPTFINTAESPLSFFAKFALSFKTNHKNSKLLLDKLKTYRSNDGGYHNLYQQHDTGSIYAAFLAYLANQDLGETLRYSQKLIQFVNNMKCSDGSFANEKNIDSGSTTTTAAALVLLAEFNEEIPRESIDCLLKRMTSNGGFLANSNAPTPDLLSTATALYALKRVNHPLNSIKSGNMDFIASLWNEDGGFAGNPFDDESDCEYTFYALLAMGCVS